ncbi:MAG: hypothetical protein WD794_16865 [Mycobacteriales bacterium]
MPVAARSELEPAFSVAGGFTPVMVITHDCQMDKEANVRYAQLRRSKPPTPKAEAVRQAEEDPELDRFVAVVPLVPPRRIRTDNLKLMSGETTGYFPLPGASEFGIAESVADLSCPTSIDRDLLVSRVASLTDEARGQLRLSLARLYAFRSPEVGFQVEDAVGKRILGFRKVPDSPLEIILDVQGGQEVRLVLQPEEPAKGRPARRAPR